MASIDQQIDGLFRPVAHALSDVAFFDGRVAHRMSLANLRVPAGYTT